ncbi:MarR family transcriptional regulator [Streptomyces sp. NPDC094032]|uniref:MarR family transcriptional regulator n=1 Tax=Streptomyces sp. NPDC094032 TaxID=3155308 RepID=UPI003331C30A
MELPDVPPLKTLAGHGAVLGSTDPSGSMLPDFGSAGQADARFALPVQQRLGLLAKLPVLSPRMHHLLAEGDTDGTYARWSRQRGGKDSAAADHAWIVTRAVAAAAARAGWSRTDFIQVMLDGPYKAGAHARLIERRRERTRAVEWLSRAWEGASAHVVSTDAISARTDFHTALAELRAQVERTPWPGVAGKTDLRNLIARLDVCEQAGGWDHAVSERDLAERMGCSRETVRRSNGRLVERGLLRQLNSGSATEAAGWMLIKPVVERSSQSWTTTQGPKAGGVLSGPTARQPAADTDSRAASKVMPEDVFTHFGLGGSGLAVVAALAENPDQTIEQLQGTASVSRPTAYRAIGKLLALGLVVKEGETYRLSEQALNGVGARTEKCPAPVRTWDEAAERLGVTGASERRKNRHAAQREHWEKLSARRAENRSTAAPRCRPHVADMDLVGEDGLVVDPLSGEVIDGLYVADDGGWIWHETEPDRAVLRARARAAEEAWMAA